MYTQTIQTEENQKPPVLLFWRENRLKPEDTQTDKEQPEENEQPSN